jgi:hypothetical protein
MAQNALLISADRIERLILLVRGEKVVPDADLARLYGVSTKRFNEQVKRNRGRFPKRFMFQLTAEEKAEVVANCDHLKKLKFSPVLPYAFTEHGAIMAAAVLNSPRAIQVSIYVVEAFVRLRGLLSSNRELVRKLAELEKELKERLDVHESAIVDILRRIMDIIDAPALPEPPRKRIGFQVKERHGLYRVNKRREKTMTAGFTIRTHL